MAILRLKCHALFLDLKVREIMVLKVQKFFKSRKYLPRKQFSDPVIDFAQGV